MPKSIHIMEDGGAGSEFNPLLIHLALLCTVVGSCISLFSVWLHWKNYRKPNQQRQVTRILWMVPIYGISTYISLVSLNVAFYVDTFRDMYEAFVIYAFFNLLLNKLGGERALIIMLHSRPPSDNFFPGTIYSRDIFVGDPYTFLFVKRGILQFVYVKPVLAIITMVLKATGNYHEGQFSWTSSYFYLTFFYNLSVCLALWCLVVFFNATKKDLITFRPLPKFLCVKAIIFFSFWQSVVVALLVFIGLIPQSEHISVAIQDFLICIEMVPFAIAHSFSFSYEDYFDQDVHSARMPIRKAIKDSLGVKDVMMDTLDTLRGSGFSYRSFEPSEGVPHMGSSRTSRIMAGLRYSNITTKKHWLDPAPTSRFLHSTLNEELDDNDHAPLEFEDPNSQDEMEQLYKASRKLEFGDYNYPVIDFRVPVWRQVRSERRQQRYGGSGYGATTTTHSTTDYRHQSQDKKSKYNIGPREGCIDVIIEQGKGNYVVVDDLSDEEAQLATSVVPAALLSPPSPTRNPTLSDIKRRSMVGPRISSSTPTLSNTDKKSKRPVLNTTVGGGGVGTSSSTSTTTSTLLDQRPQKERYPIQQAELIMPRVNSSTPTTTTTTNNNTMNTTSDNNMFTYPDTTATNDTTGATNYYFRSQQQEDLVANSWQWPETASKKNNLLYNEEDLLNGDVWK